MSDRNVWLWFAGTTAAFLIVAIMLAPGARQYAVDARLSTFRTTPDGAGAFYETLSELDVPVERRLTPLAGADSLAGTLVLLAPTEPLTPHERAALLDWVAAGGDAILALNPADPMLDEIGYRHAWAGAGEPVWSRDTTARARALPHPWTQGIDAIGPVTWTLDDSDRPDSLRATTLVVDERNKGAVALLVERGAGRILLLSEPGLLSNAAIGETGVMPLLARAAAGMTAPGETVWFDEFHHGHRGGSVSAAAWRFLTGHPVGLMLLQLIAVVVLALLPLTVRFGAPIEPQRARRRTPLEHVAALGSVYRQAHARHIARRRLLAGFTRRIGREAAPLDREADYLERLAERVPVGADAVHAVARTWQDPDADLVELSARIDQAVRTLRR